MNKYNILVIIGGRFQPFTVFADHFFTTTSNSSSSGIYSFYKNREFVASYPIDRTIISSVELVDNSTVKNQ